MFAGDLLMRCARFHQARAPHRRWTIRCTKDKRQERYGMNTRIAINGLGRIGRAVLRVALNRPSLELVAVNDLADVEALAYLFRFDTAYGRYRRPVLVAGDDLIVDGRTVPMLRKSNPRDLPWKDLGVDVVLECTGPFKRRQELESHIWAGARIVLLSAPSETGDVETVAHGANVVDGDPVIVSCASCTTNCITPIVEIVGRRIGITKAVMTTVHAYTSSQSIVDGPSKRPRRGRAGAANLVPTATGAAFATTRALPKYAGKFDGVAIRVPIPIGSIADMTFVTSRRTAIDEANWILTEESETRRYAGIVGVSRDPLVLKIMSWYDNEWGYANQMIRQAMSLIAAERRPAA